MRRLFFILVLILFSFIASAGLYCDRAELNNNNNVVTCSNDGNNPISITKVGSYFSINQETIPANSSKTITVTFQQNAPLGELGAILFNNTNPIKVNNVLQSQTGCRLIPSISTYTQAVQQGTTLTLPEITVNSKDCTSESMIDAYISGGVVSGGIYKPVSLKSISGNKITLSVDTTGLSSQTYNTILHITDTINSVNTQSNINIIVTSGTGSYTNFSINDLPVCSLSTDTLNLDSTYSLICSNMVPDVKIVPRIDTEYIIGENVETTSTQFIWKFKPVRFGLTTIKADFFYLNAPVGFPFSKDVKISSLGSGGFGTNLKLLFNPSLDDARPDEEIILQLVDNQTGSLVLSPEIYFNSIPLASNISNTFFVKLLSNTNYTIRGKAPGYTDIVETVYLTSQPLEINVTPQTGDTSTSFTINTGDVNASLFLNGNKINNPYYGSLPYGNNTVKAIAQGYFETEKNISIEFGLTAIADNFKKGVKSIIILSKNASYKLVYREKYDSLEESVLLEGVGDRIEFEPKKKGYYLIYSDDKVIFNHEIKGWDGTIIWGIRWYTFLIILAGVVVGIILIRKRGGSSSPIPFGRINTA